MPHFTRQLDRKSARNERDAPGYARTRLSIIPSTKNFLLAHDHFFYEDLSVDL